MAVLENSQAFEGCVLSIRKSLGAALFLHLEEAVKSGTLDVLQRGIWDGIFIPGRLRVLFNESIYFVLGQARITIAGANIAPLVQPPFGHIAGLIARGKLVDLCDEYVAAFKFDDVDLRADRRDELLAASLQLVLGSRGRELLNWGEAVLL